MSFVGFCCENSVYKNELSETPSDLTQREKLQWLHTQRTTGLWVQCDDCDRWRYLPDVLDSHELPKKWYCRMHPDISLNECSVPEIPITIRDTEDIFYGEYAAGSIVLAKLGGWPWWPAMVDDCPDTEKYYWLDAFSDTPTHYHVVFFDAAKVSRAWIKPVRLKPYSQNKDLMKSAVTSEKYLKRLEVSVIQANDAEKLALQSRLKIYSFIARYEGKIASPYKKETNYYKKYHETFKKQINGDFEEFSDSDEEIHQSLKSKKHKNIIFLGSKKH